LQILFLVIVGVQVVPKRTVVVGLDIGTTKIAAIVGELGATGDLSIIGLGESYSTGLRKGVVVNIELTAKAIEQAMEKAERMSGVAIGSAYIGITGPHIGSINNRGVVAITNEQKEIEMDDVRRVLQAAQVVTLQSDRRIIHIIPRQYIVDGYDGISNPVGMSGIRLEVEAVIVTGVNTAIQNILKSIGRAGVKVEELVLNSMASGEAVLSPAEKELGTVMVDIGGGTTEIAIFDRGSLWFSSVVPLGGDQVTNDLAVGLRIPITQAEELKKEHGCVLEALISDNDYIEITEVGGQSSRRVSRKLIASIIEPRIREIFAFVKAELKRSGYKGTTPGGVVLTGGTASLAGLLQLVTSELELPTRLGKPVYLGGMADIVNASGYATGIGLLLYGANHLAALQAAPSEDLFKRNYFGRIWSWLREYF